MHEWALAESIIVAVIGSAKKEKLRKITEIKISIGELQQIEKDIFEFALQQLIKEQNKKFKSVKIKIDVEKTILKCKNCEKVWGFEDMKSKLHPKEFESMHFIPEVALVYTRCPRCKSPDFEIMKGRGVTISSIKGEK